MSFVLCALCFVCMMTMSSKLYHGWSQSALIRCRKYSHNWNTIMPSWCDGTFPFVPYVFLWAIPLVLLQLLHIVTSHRRLLGRGNFFFCFWLDWFKIFFDSIDSNYFWLNNWQNDFDSFAKQKISSVNVNWLRFSQW